MMNVLCDIRVNFDVSGFIPSLPFSSNSLGSLKAGHEMQQLLNDRACANAAKKKVQQFQVDILPQPKIGIDSVSRLPRRRELFRLLPHAIARKHTFRLDFIDLDYPLTMVSLGIEAECLRDQFHGRPPPFSGDLIDRITRRSATRIVAHVDIPYFDQRPRVTPLLAPAKVVPDILDQYPEFVDLTIFIPDFEVIDLEFVVDSLHWTGPCQIEFNTAFVGKVIDAMTMPVIPQMA
jgi:hypothetical protein